MKQLILIAGVLSFAFQSSAQQVDPLSPILIIYDASGFMWGELDHKTKKEMAGKSDTFTIEVKQGKTTSHTTNF